MTIKILIISPNQRYYKAIAEFLKSFNDNILLENNTQPDINAISEEKFDLIILDSASYEKWLLFHQSVKNFNINNIFIVLADRLSIEDLKIGFKDGIYDIVNKKTVQHIHFIYDLIAINYPEYFTEEGALEVKKIIDSLSKETIIFTISNETIKSNQYHLFIYRLKNMFQKLKVTKNR